MKDIILYYFEKFFINIKEYSTINYSFFLATLILLSGCLTEKNQDAKNDYYTIDYEQCFEKEQQMLLSEIADSVEYLELKTPEGIIIRNITNIIPLYEDLIICAIDESNWKSVFLFRRNGQFARRIGSVGFGFDEYMDARDVQIDKKNSEIIIVGFVKICFYDFDGNYLRSTQPQTSYTKTSIGISDSTLWVNVAPRMRNTKVEYITTAYNKNGDTIATIPNPVSDIIAPDTSNYNPIPNFPSFYHKNGLLYLKPNYSYDTLWQISGTNRELNAEIGRAHV